MVGTRLITGGPPVSVEEARAMSPLALAYVGDAVYEIFVRERVARTGKPVRGLHSQAVKWVSAEGQEVVWMHLKPHLLDDEEDIARRGRNVKSQPPKHASVASYRRSTALEAVLGYLYLTGRTERLADLLQPALEAATAAVEGAGAASSDESDRADRNNSVKPKGE